MALGIIGFFLIILAMRLTYVPLHRLTQKFVTNPSSRESYLTQLDTVFSEAEQQILVIQEKMHNYRLSMEQSLLDSMVSLQCIDSSVILPLTDQLFDQNPNKKICIVRVSSHDVKLPPADTVLNALCSLLPEEVSCTTLNSAENSFFFLIMDTTSYPDKEKRIKEVVEKIHAECGYLFAISNSSASPMDLPSLYEETVHATSYWPHVPIVELSSLPPAPATYAYPQEQLDYLSELLTGHNFSAARILISDLFRLIRNHVNTGNSQNYFERSILVDMLTILTNQMNLSYIDFQTYNDLYFETLYYCRSCPYTEKE